jgi:hypothetical protein
MTLIRGAMLAFSLALFGGCTPLYLWDTHTTSTPRAQSFDVGELEREPVAAGLLAPSGLQGFNPSLSHALFAALAEASPPIRGIFTREILNALNERGLAAEYTDLIAGFARSVILERERLQRIGSPLGSRYMLLPARGIQSSYNRSPGTLRVEAYTEPGRHPAAVAAALGHADGPDSMGVGRGSHGSDRALKT